MYVLRMFAIDTEFYFCVTTLQARDYTLDLVYLVAALSCTTQLVLVYEFISKTRISKYYFFPVLM